MNVKMYSMRKQMHGIFVKILGLLIWSIQHITPNFYHISPSNQYTAERKNTDFIEIIEFSNDSWAYPNLLIFLG